jgi:hypothetical protein
MSLTFIRKFDEEVTQEELTHLEEWANDDSYFHEYAPYELLRDEVLVRVYKYTPEDSEEDPLFDENFEPLAAIRERVLPFAKVIKVGPTGKIGLCEGDIVSLMEAVGMKTYNPDYLEWRDRKLAQPQFDEPRPDVYIYGLDKLQSMMFIRDKVMGHQPEDSLTFLLPEGLIRTKVNFNV